MEDNDKATFYLNHILDNAELFSEWIREGRKAKDFLLTIPSKITYKDIKWAQKSIGITS